MRGVLRDEMVKTRVSVQVTPDGVKVPEENIQKILEGERPQSKRDVQVCKSMVWKFDLENCVQHADRTFLAVLPGQGRIFSTFCALVFW